MTTSFLNCTVARLFRFELLHVLFLRSEPSCMKILLGEPRREKMCRSQRGQRVASSACEQAGRRNSLAREDDVHCSAFFGFTATRNHTALATSHASELAVSGETTGSADLATLCAYAGVKVFTVTSFVGCSSLKTASFCTCHTLYTPLDN